MRTTLALSAVTLAFVAACSATSSNTSGNNNGGQGGGGNNGGAGNGSLGGGGGFQLGGGGQGGTVIEGDPKTCEEAAIAKSYLGCDFWPTVTANNVWSVFDFAVVVANAGDEPADVAVMQGTSTLWGEAIGPNELKTIYLPWVPALKGPDADACGSAVPLSATVRAADGAYHLTSTRPVTVYQFNALEYAPQGGPPGKNWNACPASQCFLDCFSYSNDASLLLPSTALTGNYRVTGLKGWQPANMSPTLTVTGTADGTSVTVTLSSTGSVTGGGGVSNGTPGSQVTFSLNRGEVVELVGTPTSDFSGSLVQATAPVQVITGMPCVNVPESASACDHIEESVFPAETLGKRYFVTVPTGPNGQPVGHVVRLYGNVTTTNLTYPSGAPAGAPSQIGAGQVIDLGQVSQDFEIVGDHELAVASFQLGASIVDPGGALEQRGDPAQSLMTAVEQYRKKYVFLAPSDYPVSYVDVVMPTTAVLTLDGTTVSPQINGIGSGFGVARITLSSGGGGSHVLEATEPVGIQVIGYGSYTSYQYPGGLNLTAIAPPPPPPN